MIKLIEVVAGVVVCASCALGQSPIVVSDLTRLKTVSGVDVAPDGSYCVYVVREIVEQDDGYAYRNHLWRAELDGEANARALTSGERQASSPVISPDGRTLAFVRTGEDDSSQVWLMPMDAPGEARQLTTLEHGAGRPVWRPDGNALLVSSSIPAAGEIEGVPTWSDERVERSWGDARSEEGTDLSPDGDLAEVRQWLAANADEDDPFVITRLSFQGEQGLRGEMRFAHLFVVDVEDGEATQITDGFESHSGAIWSPDGAFVYFTSDADQRLHPDRSLTQTLRRIDADGSNRQHVAGHAAIDVRGPEFGKDGVLRVACRDADDPLYAQWEVCDVVGSELTMRTDGWDAPVSSYWGMSDGSLIITSPWQGTFPIMVIGEDDQVMPVALDGNAGVRSMDVDGGRIVAAVTTVKRPTRVVMIDDDGQERVLHDPNAWVGERRLSMPEAHWIEREDGTRVQYWVMAPTAGREGGGERAPSFVDDDTAGAGARKRKTVLEIHGGPAAMWGPGELSMWHEFQLLCAHGYGLVYSNPRGSGGYGYDFKRANERDWGVGPAGDVLACLDDAVRRYDWIDEDRLVVTGGSYAGYLTAWIVAHDHRFKAALAQRGVYDLTTFFGEGNAWRLVAWAFGTYPAGLEPGTRAESGSQKAAILDEQSPFSHAHAIQTPLLIMHASQDLRTGVSQSEMLYRALKVMNKPVEYIRYPGAGHDLSRTGDPDQRMDRLARIVEWFERFVGDHAD